MPIVFSIVYVWQISLRKRSKQNQTIVNKSKANGKQTTQSTKPNRQSNRKHQKQTQASGQSKPTQTMPSN
jgi:hypothetical protein